MVSIPSLKMQTEIYGLPRATGFANIDVPDRSIKVVDIVGIPTCGGPAVPITVRLVNTGSKAINQFDIVYSINDFAIRVLESVSMTILPVIR